MFPILCIHLQQGDHNKLERKKQTQQVPILIVECTQIQIEEETIKNFKKLMKSEVTKGNMLDTKQSTKIRKRGQNLGGLVKNIGI